MRWLTLGEVLVLHAYQIEKFGGNSSIRDIKLLESAVSRPSTSFSGKDLYETIYLKAATLAFGIIKNHPFVDGNKRTGIHAMIVFLELNKTKVKFTNSELVKLGKDIANNKMDVESVAEVLKKNS
jgi:death on curing protein